MVLVSPAPRASRLGIEHPLPSLKHRACGSGSSSRRTELARLSQEEAVSLVLAQHAEQQASAGNVTGPVAIARTSVPTTKEAKPAVAATRVRKRVNRMTKSGRRQQAAALANARGSAPRNTGCTTLADKEQGVSAAAVKLELPAASAGSTVANAEREVIDPARKSGEVEEPQLQPQPNPEPEPQAASAGNAAANATREVIGPGRKSSELEEPQLEPKSQPKNSGNVVETVEAAPPQQPQEEPALSPPSVRSATVPPKSPAPAGATLKVHYRAGAGFAVRREPQQQSNSRRRGSTGVFSCCASNGAHERRRRSVNEPPASATMYA